MSNQNQNNNQQKEQKNSHPEKAGDSSIYETQLDKTKQKAEKQGYISLSKASKLFSVSQPYLNVLIHRDKIKGKKFGRNWHTTKESVQEYVDKTRKKTTKPVPTSVPAKSTQAKKPTPKQKKRPKEEKQFFQSLVTKLEQINGKAEASKLKPEERDFVHTGSQGLGYKLKKFNEKSKKNFKRGPNLLLMVTAIVILFLIVGGISFGNIDPLIQKVKKVFKDATTIQGHWPGTHANEVLLLNEQGDKKC